MVRATLQALLLVALLGALLFGAAGRLDWPMAWAFLLAYVVFVLATFALVEPDLVRERSRPGPGVHAGDVVLASVSFALLFPAALIVSALDVVRFGWSRPLPLPVQLAALAVFVLGYGFALWAMRSNRFFATFVRIQSDRGHEVVSRGPYALLRHPGYAGAILAHLALPLALGSRWGLAPAVLGGIGFVLRTHREDRTLARELPGYREYQARVRWRLVPGLW